MKAAVLGGIRQPFVVEEVELDPPRAREVLVRMVATGVCHSDLHTYTGDLFRDSRPFPIILGHEGAGVIEAVGPEVTRFRAGDHVILTYLPACGKCRWCHIGQPNMCDMGAYVAQGLMPDGTRRLHTLEGGDISNFLFLSTFAEYAVVPEDSLVPVGPDVPLERVCLLGCGFSTGFGAATNAIHIRPGETVTIVGCGGLGLAGVQGARVSGAGKIIAVDLHPEKLEMARRFGATHLIQNRHDPDAVVAEVLEITWGVGTDYTLEYVGTEQCEETIDIAFRSLRKGGTMCLVGVGPNRFTTIPVEPWILTNWNKRIYGVLFGDAQFQVDIPRYVQLYQDGKIDLDGIVTREYRLEDINTTVENILAGNRVARQVIRFD